MELHPLMKTYLAYIRVSTAKQGEHGSSLQEQKTAIEAFATRQGLVIGEWFEERETAAKEGRREFSRMLSELQSRNAAGVIIHKIDRGARNLRDWANLGDLIDQGVDVQFVQDSLDLQSRGGRLSADIQAVVAADYIRNLREEVKKGFYGRLKQGLYPLPAPVGYVDMGGGKPKQPHPTAGPLVRYAFEAYATGEYSLRSLAAKLDQLGLRPRRGAHFSVNAVAGMLHNPFYTGIIHITTTGETFEGVHQPLVSIAVFDRVQQVLRGKANTRIAKHDFLFRTVVRCATCGHAMTGERQKGRYVYYRCHRESCRPTIATEQDLNSLVTERLSALRCDEYEMRDINSFIDEWEALSVTEEEQRRATLRIRLTKCEERLHRLTDALVDGLIDKELFDSRKSVVLREKLGIAERLALPSETVSCAATVRKYFELQNTAYFLYSSDIPSEKREILRRVTSNLSVSQKKPAFTLKSPFQEIAEQRIKTFGGPSQGTVRTGAKSDTKKLFEILKSAATKEIENGASADNLPLAA